MKGVIVSLVAISLFYFCYGSSNPVDVIANCDATSSVWGCDAANWVKGDRTNCSEKGQLMYWASKPVRNSCYKLYAGSETAPVTSYIPRQLLTFKLRTECYGMNFRGILLYAVNKDEKKVGDWENVGGDDADFKTPWPRDDPCGGSLMHASAELKPYLSTMYFKTPEVGTGTINFRCLIKYGDANDGAFYFVEKDVSLTEASVPTSNTVYELGAAGQSCDEVCSAKGSRCDESAINNRASFSREVIKKTPCLLPILSGCGKDAGTYDADQFCYYPESDCSNRTANRVNCQTKITDVQRFCACSGTAPIGTGNDGNNNGNDGDNVQSSASVLRGVSAIIAMSMFFVSPRLATVFFALWGLSNAHNWVNSQARSSFANTVRPCKPATTVLPHMQVGPKQVFNIEWVTAHGGPVYFSVVNAKNQHWLKSINEKLLEDYIASAPASGQFNATQGKYQRMHRTDRISLDNRLSSGAVRPNYFLRFVNETDPLYIRRDKNMKGSIGFVGDPYSRPEDVVLLQYKTESLNRDRVVSYKSDKYPWLEGVWKYQLTALQAARVDTANFWVPGFSGYGRYIFHYYWASYRDAIDVDYVENQVEFVYGSRSGETKWKRVDHCLFNYRAVLDFTEVVTDVSYCLRKCDAKKCGGVNLVPLKAPASTYNFKQPFNVTWYHPEILGSDIYVDWNQTVFKNRSAEVDRMLKGASPERFMCYVTRPIQPTTTVDLYQTTKDPADPVFYSTCYHPYRGNLFPGYDTSSVPAIDIKTDWHFYDKCLSCESVSYNNFDNVAPAWNIVDKCINCDKEPKASPPRVPLPVYTIENLTKCDGLDGVWLKSSHHSCPSNDTCVIQIWPAGRLDTDSVSYEECKVIAAENEECSNTMIWEAGALPGNQKACYCYSKASCCGTCSRVADKKFNTYEVNKSTADPTCSNGTLSDDKKSCCSKSCGAGNCVPNGKPSDSTGFCCSACIKNRPCSDFAAPCMI